MCAQVVITPRTPDLEVQVSSIASPNVLSLDKELYSAFSLFTQVYKMCTSDILLGRNLVID